MMPAQLVKNKLDNRNRKLLTLQLSSKNNATKPPSSPIEPDINQSYLIPAPYVHPTNPNLSSNMNHFAVYSMWEHFVDFIATDSLSVVVNPRPVHTTNPQQEINYFTGRHRLRCFKQLSLGQSIEKMEVLSMELASVVLANE